MTTSALGLQPTPSTERRVREEIQKIPDFLNAIGIGTDAVALTLYGGDGGNWHRKKAQNKSHCQPVNLFAVLDDLPTWSIDGYRRNRHQLGFYSQWGGSTKEQSQGSPCLKVESDNVSKEDQLAVLRAYEHCYDVLFTLVDTGGKSIHAYLAIDEQIAPDRYQLHCRLFHDHLVSIARQEGIPYEPDSNVTRITQAMRLPGAIHCKTVEVATLLQLGKKCSLDQIECSWSDVESSRRESVTCRAVAGSCQGGRVLGYEGDEAMQILISIVQAWEKRIVGQDTYSKVLPLVANLTAVLGVEQAAQLLYNQGHNDKNGQHDLQGLVDWCSSFTDPQDPAEATARLISIAGSRYGWDRPKASTAIITDPATEHINTEEELRTAIQGRSILTNCRTGKGKSKQSLGVAVEMYDESRHRNGDRSMFSVGVLSPRRTINAQNAQRTSGRDVSTGRGSREDFYLGCIQSWGKDDKCHGNSKLWLNGVMPAAGLLIIDELRQVIEGLVLGKAGPGEFWDSPAERVEAFARLVWSIRNAAQLYGMDAQLGRPEIDFINHVRRRGSRPLPIIGNPREDNGGVFRWTPKQNTWKQALLQAIQDPERTKPVLVVTGGKGEEINKSTGGMSAWSLKRYIEAETEKELCSPHLRKPITSSLVNVVVIDSINKDDEQQRRILMDKDMGDANVVIVTPVAQSGFSFIGDFHEVGFVAGGLTLPPNCVSQGARRERTLKTCYGYLPRYEFDPACPFFTSDKEENAKVVLEAMLDHERDIDNLDSVEELMMTTTLAYWERSINELSMFTDYSLAYLHQDGWTLDALPDAEHVQKPRKRAPKASKQAKVVTPFDELSEGTKLVLKGLAGHLSAEQVAAIEGKAISGGLVDLVGANAVKLVNLLRRSGLYELCDGTPRAKTDQAVIDCGVMLQSSEAATLFRRSNVLDVRQSRADDKAANAVKTVGVIVRQLGGTWERCGKGRSKIQGHLPEPEGCL